MLVRARLSRILFLRQFFSYPITLSLATLWKLGLKRVVKIVLSYLKICLHGPGPERSLEDFFINRFGVELYRTFFRDYTEKVWGVPCSQIQPEWGAQRVKGLSVLGTVIRVPKTYPAYFGTYGEFTTIRQFLDGIPNLYCIGRNGQHRYNNQDHSMLSAMVAVEVFASGAIDKAAIWDVNTEESYHESK